MLRVPRKEYEKNGGRRHEERKPLEFHTIDNPTQMTKTCTSSALEVGSSRPQLARVVISSKVNKQLRRRTREKQMDIVSKNEMAACFFRFPFPTGSHAKKKRAKSCFSFGTRRHGTNHGRWIVIMIFSTVGCFSRNPVSGFPRYGDLFRASTILTGGVSDWFHAYTTAE